MRRGLFLRFGFISALCLTLRYISPGRPFEERVFRLQAGERRDLAGN